jgi:chromosomal replication initiation ATPase DnaA
VRQVLETAGEQLDREALAASRDLTVGTLMERVADHFNVATSELKAASKVRRVSIARTIFRVFAVRDLGATCAELSGILGLSPYTREREQLASAGIGCRGGVA